MEDDRVNFSPFTRFELHTSGVHYAAPPIVHLGMVKYRIYFVIRQIQNVNEYFPKPKNYVFTPSSEISEKYCLQQESGLFIKSKT